MNMASLRPSTSVRPRPTVEPTWQAEMRAAIRRLDVLVERLGLAPSAAPGVEAKFPVFVPEPFLARIRPGDPHDPLLRQVLPWPEELVSAPGFVLDPLDEHGGRPANLLRKYAGRALLVTTGACAIHCRYCFRREFPYGESPPNESAWSAAREAVENDPTVDEVLFSGGDPLTVADEPLSSLLQSFAEIPHVRRLRMHTRVPTVIPSRVTDRLLETLGDLGKPVIVVVHVNHAQELDETTAAALARLKPAVSLLLNQAVLLRGVNDSVEALVALSERLVEIGVAPYYLHQLDRTAGTAHFEVDESQGRRLIQELTERLPGYAVPKYVRETPGAASKSPIP